MSARVQESWLTILVLTGGFWASTLLGGERVAGDMHGKGDAARRRHMARESYYGSPEIGKKLFTARGCAACHAVRGVGGTLGPDLGKMFHEHNVFQMAARFWSHSPAMLKTLQEMKREWPKLMVLSSYAPQAHNVRCLRHPALRLQ